MTAYANVSLQKEWGRAKWEIKSVNHRYLELSFKLPERLRGLEASLRELVKQNLHRGKVECWLNVEMVEAKEAKDTPPLNLPLLKQLSKACQHIQHQFSSEVQFTLSPLDILKWPEVWNDTEMNVEPLYQELRVSFEKALQALIEQRLQEGAALNIIMQDRFVAMENITIKIQTRIPDIVKNQRDKILSRLNELSIEINSDRLEQEIVYYTQKMDITEEIERLLTHIKSGKEALQKGGVIGRHMDFLMQELNREANTLTSKSSELDIIQMAMELKVLIEQIREQVQNIE